MGIGLHPSGYRESQQCLPVNDRRSRLSWREDGIVTATGRVLLLLVAAISGRIYASLPDHGFSHVAVAGDRLYAVLNDYACLSLVCVDATRREPQWYKVLATNEQPYDVEVIASGSARKTVVVSRQRSGALLDNTSSRQVRRSICYLLDPVSGAVQHRVELEGDVLLTKRGVYLSVGGKICLMDESLDEYLWQLDRGIQSAWWIRDGEEVVLMMVGPGVYTTRIKGGIEVNRDPDAAWSVLCVDKRNGVVLWEAKGRSDITGSGGDSKYVGYVMSNKVVVIDVDNNPSPRYISITKETTKDVFLNDETVLITTLSMAEGKTNVEMHVYSPETLQRVNRIVLPDGYSPGWTSCRNIVDGWAYCASGGDWLLVNIRTGASKAVQSYGSFHAMLGINVAGKEYFSHFVRQSGLRFLCMTDPVEGRIVPLVVFPQSLRNTYGSPNINLFMESHRETKGPSFHGDRQLGDR